MAPLRFFPTPAKFGEWLHKNHESAAELWVGFYRKDAGRRSIIWPESVDEALRFGWIDGVRKTVDDVSYMIPFTPRRPNSVWSKVNIAKVEALTAADRMTPACLAAYARRTPERSGIYAFERATATFDAASERVFRRNKTAWRFFESQPPYYRHVTTYHVTSAKKPETRARRLAALIECSAKGQRIPQLTRPAK